MAKRPRPPGWGVPGDWQQYFKDESAQHLAEMAVDLAAAVWVAIDRQQVLEWLLESKGQLAPGEIAAFKPPPEQELELTARRDEFLSQMFQTFRRALTKP